MIYPCRTTDSPCASTSGFANCWHDRPSMHIFSTRWLSRVQPDQVRERARPLRVGTLSSGKSRHCLSSHGKSPVRPRPVNADQSESSPQTTRTPKVFRGWRSLSQSAAAKSFRRRLKAPLAGCGKSLPPQDAAFGDPQKPRLFGGSHKWKKAMDGFFHGQLVADGVSASTIHLRHRFWLAFAVVVAGTFFAIPTRVHAEEWAQKMFAETTYNFGTVARGSKTEHRFKFRNIYKEDIHVSGVRTSCGCTHPVVTKDLLKSHETSEVIATFNTTTFLGQHGATLTVMFDQPYYAEVQLRVDGNIRNDVFIDPPSINLGNVELGQGAQQSVRVTRTGSLPWQITDVRSANSMFEVTLSKPTRTETQTTYELTLSLKPEAAAGYINDDLILITNDPLAERIPMDVEGRVVAAVTISPELLSMGMLRPGESVTKNLVVKANRPFRVLNVECEDSRFQVTIPEREAALQVLPITFSAGADGSLERIERRLQIVTSLGQDSVPTVMVQAMVEPPAAAAAGL
jgi:hypothetical protein